MRTLLLVILLSEIMSTSTHLTEISNTKMLKKSIYFISMRMH